MSLLRGFRGFEPGTAHGDIRIVDQAQGLCNAAIVKCDIVKLPNGKFLNG